LPAGEQIAPVIRDEPLWQLPVDERLDVDAVAAVRLPVAVRGYRFAETDLLLDRLGEELRERDVEIAGLRAALRRHQGDPSDAVAPAAELGVDTADDTASAERESLADLPRRHDLERTAARESEAPSDRSAPDERRPARGIAPIPSSHPPASA